jgi:hypothetical protein
VINTKKTQQRHVDAYKIITSEGEEKGKNEHGDHLSSSHKEDMNKPRETYPE